ncbi:MAG: peptidase signal peptidase [Bacillales bacterium]|nr:peptidase signal peptidase [Bacillales bacterium]
MFYLLLTMLLCGEDQYLKNKIDQDTELGQDTEIFNGNIIKTKTYNKGAFLSFLEGKTAVLHGLSIILLAIVAVTYICTLLSKGKNVLKLGLSLLTAGAMSNVYDRLKRGHVIDYFSFKGLRNVVFNIGDMFIFLGSILILFRELLKRD